MRKLLMLSGVVALTVLGSASSAFAHQSRAAMARAGHVAMKHMLAQEKSYGPGWVVRNLRNRHYDGAYGFGNHGDQGGNGGWNGDGNWGGNGNGWGGGGGQGNGGHNHTFVCNGTYSDLSVRDLVVPSSDVCLITNSTIRGDVSVGSNGDFEAGSTWIGGNVRGDQALTIYVYDGSTVGGRLKAIDTAQVFAFNSTIDSKVKVDGATDQVFLCGNTIGNGIKVENSGPNILVGDDNDPNCAGNVVQSGDVWVTDNATYVELVVGDNTIQNGDMFVFSNTGTPTFTSGESVIGNQGGHALACFDNDSPFVGAPNPGWKDYYGQCSAT